MDSREGGCTNDYMFALSLKATPIYVLDSENPNVAQESDWNNLSFGQVCHLSIFTVMVLLS